MDYEIVTLEEKIIAGVTARTSNDAPDMGQVIGKLWESFMGKHWNATKNKTNAYSIGLYSDYDETSYDVTIGCEVAKFENPELSSKIIPAGKYAKFSIHGDVVTAVQESWDEIWKMPLDRSYAADFEEYLNNDNGIADINIYIALK